MVYHITYISYIHKCWLISINIGSSGLRHCCNAGMLVYLQLMKLEYSRIIISIPWLLMPWLLTSESYQQPWYWLHIKWGPFLSNQTNCEWWLLVIHQEDFHLSAAFQSWEAIENANIFVVCSYQGYPAKRALPTMLLRMADRALLAGYPWYKVSTTRCPLLRSQTYTALTGTHFCFSAFTFSHGSIPVQCSTYPYCPAAWGK